MFLCLDSPDSSPEAQPKYIKGGKRYGRRSLPEFQESVQDFAEVTVIEPLGEEAHPAHIAAAQEVSREGWGLGWLCHLCSWLLPTSKGVGMCLEQRHWLLRSPCLSLGWVLGRLCHPGLWLLPTSKGDWGVPVPLLAALLACPWDQPCLPCSMGMGKEPGVTWLQCGPAIKQGLSLRG